MSIHTRSIETTSVEEPARPQGVITFTPVGTTTITGNPSPALSSYDQLTEQLPYVQVAFFASGINTGPVTLSLNGLPPLPIYKVDHAIDVPLAPGDIVTHQYVQLAYYPWGPSFQMLTPDADNTGPTGAPGPAGPAGPQGEVGPPGASASIFSYSVDTTNNALSDPGTGKFKYDNPTQSLSTNLIIDWITQDGFDVVNIFMAMTPPDEFMIQARDLTTNYQIWRLVGPAVNMPDWFYAPVEFVSSSGAGTFSNNTDVDILILAKGATGPPGPPGIPGPIGPAGGASIVQDDGIPLPLRGVVNLVGPGVTAVDDIANGRTNVTIPGNNPWTANIDGNGFSLSNAYSLATTGPEGLFMNAPGGGGTYIRLSASSSSKWSFGIGVGDSGSNNFILYDHITTGRVIHIDSGSNPDRTLYMAAGICIMNQATVRRNLAGTTRFTVEDSGLLNVFTIETTTSPVGFRLHSANGVLDFSANSNGGVVRQLYLGTDGNVGIGTVPAQANNKLEVSGTIISSVGSSHVVLGARGDHIIASGETGFGIYYDGIANCGRLECVSAYVAWRNIAVNVIGGNFGIGTDTPGVKLDILDQYASMRLVSTVGNADMGITIKDVSREYKMGINVGASGMGVWTLFNVTAARAMFTVSDTVIKMYLGGTLKTLSVDGSGFVKAT
jgi:hypothetical protein